MTTRTAENGASAGFLAYVARGLGGFQSWSWAFLLGGGGCVALMFGGLTYFVATQRQLPRLSLYVLEDGERYFRAGDPAAALREFEAAAAVSPADTQNLVNLGAAAYALGDRETAARSFREALRFDANHPEATYFLGVIYLQRNQLDEAIALMERSVSVRAGPEAAPTWNDLGVAYERQGQVDRAIECFRRALELDPGFDRARQNLQRLSQANGGSVR
jgi:tetratricopeptide (TPR) repeat protein